MKIVLLSDTHELHRDVVVPDGGLLIHAGDITFFRDGLPCWKIFNAWLGELPHLYKVVVPGNHDQLLVSPERRRLITKAHLLVDEGLEIGGLRIWGSPVTPHADVAFGISEPKQRAEHWAGIPEGLDILITHGPPHNVLDAAPGAAFHSGCPQLRAAVISKRPRLHVFGHVHGAYGTRPTEHTMFVNAALPGEFGDLEKAPITLHMEPRAR